MADSNETPPDESPPSTSPAGPTGNAPEGPTGTVLLNGIRDVVTGGRTVLGDESSERVLSEAYRAGTTASEREAVAAAFDRVSEADAPAGGKGVQAVAGEHERALADAVAAVSEELDGRDASLVVDHETPLALRERPARVHRFLSTRDSAVLAPLADSGAVADGLATGGSAASDGRMGSAADAFRAAVDAAPDDTAAAVATRVLTAWAHHRAGDDAAALEFVREALLRDHDAWDARLVGVAADHSSPEWFREGRLASEAYLRVRAVVPDRAGVEAAVLTGPEGTAEWLDGDTACFPVQRLPTDGRLRLRLGGPPGALPVLQVYYLAVGVVEPESTRPRSVEQTLLDGPDPGSATERLRIRLP